METEKKLTGYPSIDKPWLKYYSEEAKNAIPPNCSMYEYLLERNKDNINGTAIIYFGNKITYGEMFREIDKIASSLSAIGINQGDHVSIMSLNTPETIYLYYALNKIGAVACMEYITHSVEMIKKSFETVRPKAIFILDVIYKKYKEDIHELNSAIILLPLGNSMQPIAKIVTSFKNKTNNDNGVIDYKNFLKKGGANVVAGTKNTHNPCVLLSTSGTTGVPKKVALSNYNINCVVFQYINSGMIFNRGEKFVGAAPMFFAFGITLCVHLPLCLGVTIISVFDIEKCFDVMRKNKVEHILCGAQVIPQLYKKNKDLSYLRTLAIGGESMTPEQVNYTNIFLKDHNAKTKLITGYGMTELSGTVVTEMHSVTKLNTVGVPQLLVNVKIVDTETGDELKYNEIGEILINSPSMMIEYLNNLLETEKTIIVDKNGTSWIHTGDLGKIDKDGYVYIMGRIKRIFITKQHNDPTIYKLFPDYVEKVILSHNLVNNCAVVAIPDDRLINVAVAFIVTDEQSKNIEQILNNYIHSQTSEYNIPYLYITIDEIPLLSNGKKDYRALEKIAKEKMKGNRL